MSTQPPPNPLTLAIEAGDAARVESLCREYTRLIHTFDAMVVDDAEEQWLPLHCAARRGYVDMLRTLLGHGANVDALTRFATPDRARATALHWAAGMGHVDAVTLLLDQGAVIDLRDVAGATPLHYACGHGQPGTATLLARRGADHEARDAVGRTPLLLAIACHTDAAGDVARMLIEHGVDVNAVNPKQPRRYTALHACIDAGPHRLPVARRLLDAGAECTIKDPESLMTPHEVAQMFVRLGHVEYQTYVDHVV
jgi:ankyrin repeat protein